MITAVGTEIEAPELRLGLAARLRAWAGVHRRSLQLATPLLVVVGIVHAWGMTRSPGFVDDEGTYTAQAWAIEHWGQLAHYTYWYDHPPLGWIQISAWTWLTDAFDRLPSAVDAGREAMLVAKVASAALLFVLCRRLGLRRGFALLALALYGLSPLAIALTRSVYLDNIAVPWMLGAFVLALSPRRHLAAAAVSGLCFALAVLSKETTLVLLPAWAWLLWRHADRRNRSFVMTIAMSCGAATMAFYPLVALLRGEFLGGSDRVSMMWAIRWQLFERTTSGSVFDPASSASAIVKQWMGLDSLLLTAGLIAVVPAMLSRRLRPIAAVFVIQVVVLLRGGYLPFPYVIVMLPFAAVLVAGVLDGWSRRGSSVAGDRAAATGGLPFAMRRAAAIGGVVVIAGCASATWPDVLHRQLTEEPALAMGQAVRWVDDHVGHDETIVVHDAAWVDLIQRGFSPERVLWFYKLDLDPGVQLPNGWRDIDYLLLAENMPNLDESPTTRAAIEHSVVAASFGSGDDRVVVREVGTEPRPRSMDPVPPVDTSQLADGAPPADMPPATPTAGESAGPRELAAADPEPPGGDDLAAPTAATPSRSRTAEAQAPTATTAAPPSSPTATAKPATVKPPTSAAPKPTTPPRDPPAVPDPAAPGAATPDPPDESPDEPGRGNADPGPPADPPGEAKDKEEKDDEVDADAVGDG